MPLEIRELVIKATIDNDKGNSTDSSSNASGQEDKSKIINQCVEKVLEVLKQRKER